MNETEKSMFYLLEKGNELAFNYFHSKYSKHVNTAARLILGDGAAADDVFQEVFSQLWKNRKQLDVNILMKDYLLNLVKEVCVAYKSREESQPNELPNVEEEGDGFSALARKEFLANVYEAILQVYPPACREILWLHVVEQKTYKEIALELNIGVRVVRNQMCKARKSLRGLLGLVSVRHPRWHRSAF